MKFESLTNKFIHDIAYIDFELTGESGVEFEWFLRGEKRKIIEMIEFFNLDRGHIMREAEKIQMTMVEK